MALPQPVYVLMLEAPATIEGRGNTQGLESCWYQEAKLIGDQVDLGGLHCHLGQW